MDFSATCTDDDKYLNNYKYYYKYRINFSVGTGKPRFICGRLRPVDSARILCGVESV